MTYTEAQKRANKKWRENNKEHYCATIKMWKLSQPDFKAKNNDYIKKFRARVAMIKDEFRSLCAIEL